MGRYSVLIKASAAKEIDDIGSKKDRQRVVAKIGELADNPRPVGVQKLSGAEKYRIRCGSYRILYSIEDDQLVVFVVKVGDRKEVYRKGRGGQEGHSK